MLMWYPRLIRHLRGHNKLELTRFSSEVKQEPPSPAVMAVVWPASWQNVENFTYVQRRRITFGNRPNIYLHQHTQDPQPTGTSTPKSHTPYSSPQHESPRDSTSPHHILRERTLASVHGERGLQKPSTLYASGWLSWISHGWKTVASKDRSQWRPVTPDERTSRGSAIGHAASYMAQMFIVVHGSGMSLGPMLLMAGTGCHGVDNS